MLAAVKQKQRQRYLVLPRDSSVEPECRFEGQALLNSHWGQLLGLDR